MKKIFVLILTFAMFFNGLSLPTIKPAKAYSSKTEYLRVINKKTPFFKSVLDSEPLFYLPYTYYVKVLGQENEYTHVEIQGKSSVAIDGYVNSQDLFCDGLEVSAPYLNLNIITTSTTVLYLDPTLSTPLQYVFAERELCYYGEYTQEQGRVFFVGYNDRLGYIKENAVLPFTIPNHPNALTFLTPETPNEESFSNDREGIFSIKAVIFACLLFAGIIALIFALTNKRQTKSSFNYFEENDYE